MTWVTFILEQRNQSAVKRNVSSHDPACPNPKQLTDEICDPRNSCTKVEVTTIQRESESKIFTTKTKLNDLTRTKTKKKKEVSLLQLLLLLQPKQNQLKKKFKMFQHQQISAIIVTTRHRVRFKPKSSTAEQSNIETVCTRWRSPSLRTCGVPQGGVLGPLMFLLNFSN